MTAAGPAELAPLDALMLKGDADPATRAVMTAVLVLDGVPDWPRLVSAFEAASLAVPRMRQKVVVPLLPSGLPEWVPDPAFDLRYHLRRLGGTGDRSLGQVLQTVSAAVTAPFDRFRPLWEATLIENAAGGAVLVLRAHHVLADGLGAIQMIGALLDLDPDQADRSPLAVPDLPDITPAPLLASRLARLPLRLAQAMPVRNLEVMLAAWQFTLWPGESMARLSGWANSVRRLMTTDGAAPSPLLRARGRARQFAALDIPLAPLKHAANDAGCTVNDAYLAALLGGFRRYQCEHGVAVSDVPMALPISVRGNNQGLSGNHFSAAVLAGPATIEDPVDRMRRISELVRQARAEPGLDAAQRLAPVLARLPLAVAALGLAGHARRIDLQASNLLGAPVPTYLAGQWVRRLYPFGPLPGIPVMTVLLSHNGTCCVGITLDPAAIKAPDLFLTCVCEGFDEVLGGRAAAVRADGLKEQDLECLGWSPALFERCTPDGVRLWSATI